MAGPLRMVVLFAAGAGMLATGGCIKTSDGSYELKNPPKMPSYLVASSRRKAAEREAELALNSFPDEPRKVSTAPRKRIVPTVSGWTPMVQTPFKPAKTADAALTCRNETSTTGRVRVVCE